MTKRFSLDDESDLIDRDARHRIYLSEDLAGRLAGVAFDYIISSRECMDSEGRCLPRHQYKSASWIEFADGLC